MAHIRFDPSTGHYASWAHLLKAHLVIRLDISFGLLRAHLTFRLRESWIRGCSGSRTIPSAGLLDYEDTRLKTSFRVRMGLSLAWKAILAMRIFRFPTIVTDFV